MTGLAIKINFGKPFYQVVYSGSGNENGTNGTSDSSTGDPDLSAPKNFKSKKNNFRAGKNRNADITTTFKPVTAELKAFTTPGEPNNTSDTTFKPILAEPRTFTTPGENTTGNPS